MSDDFMLFYLNIGNVAIRKGSDDIFAIISLEHDIGRENLVARSVLMKKRDAPDLNTCDAVYVAADSHDVLLEGAGAPCLLGNRGGLDNERRRGDFLVAIEHDLGDAGLSLEAGEVDA